MYFLILLDLFNISWHSNILKVIVTLKLVQSCETSSTRDEEEYYIILNLETAKISWISRFKLNFIIKDSTLIYSY